MKLKNIKMHVLLLVFLNIGNMYAIADDVGIEGTTSNSETRMKQKLLDSLAEFSKAHGIESTELKRLLGEALFADQSFPVKAGISTIGKNIYVKVGDPKNEISVDGKTWNAGSVGTTELVVIEGSQIVDRIKLRAFDKNRNVAFVVFDKGRVYYFDWADFEGGYFSK